MKIKMEDGTILELKEGTYVSEDEEVSLSLDEAEEQILAGKVEIVSEAKAKAKAKKEAEDDDDGEEEEEVKEGKKSKSKKEADGDDEDEDEDENVDEGKKSKSKKEADGDDEDEDEDEDDEGEEDDSDDEDEDEKSESKKKKNEEVELSFGDLDVTSDVNEMFGDNEFSDEFKEKAGVIYESAVKSTIRAHAEKIEEGMEAKIEESVRTGLDEITSNLNNYLDYIAEEWMVENKLAVESGIKTEITEDFIKGLRTVFENAYVDIPDEARDLVAEQTARIDELEIQLDEELNRKISMKTELHEANKKAVFDQVCEDLTYTEKAKMTTLAEDLDYETNEDYLNKLNILKENYFKTDVQEDSSEAPVEATTASPDVSDSMSSYISAIAQMTDK
jgi:hypothetical protein